MILPAIVQIKNADKSENARVFRENIEEWLSAVNDAIKRYSLSHTSSQISHIYLYGGSPQVKWLKTYMEKYLGVTTTVVQQLDCIKIPDEYDQSDNTVPQFLNVLNLLLIK